MRPPTWFWRHGPKTQNARFETPTAVPAGSHSAAYSGFVPRSWSSTGSPCQGPLSQVLGMGMGQWVSAAAARLIGQYLWRQWPGGLEGLQSPPVSGLLAPPLHTCTHVQAMAPKFRPQPQATQMVVALGRAGGVCTHQLVVLEYMPLSWFLSGSGSSTCFRGRNSGAHNCRLQKHQHCICTDANSR